MSNIPYEEIQRDEDRSWTARLIERLRDPMDPEHEAIAKTLECLDDPRAIGPLTCVLESPDLPVRIREHASAIMRSWGHAPPSSVLRAWWASGDPVLEKHALLSMDHAAADIVTAVASAPGHRLHAEAIDTIAMGFEEPRFQQLKIAALEHSDPRVRRTAADALHWDEPVAAEDALLRHVADPVVEVAVEAIRTLRYYSTRRTVTVLASLSAHPDESIRAESFDSLRELRWSFLRELENRRLRVCEALAAWAYPATQILTSSDEDLKIAASAGPEPRAAAATEAEQPPSAQALIDALTDPGGLWAEKKRSIRAAGRYPSERARLTPFFVMHPDPGIRAEGCFVLGAWNEQAALVQLVSDASFCVRKRAMYALGQCAPTESLAALIWAHLHRPDVVATHAYETLLSYVKHAPKAEAIPRLANLVRADERESVRVHAVFSLEGLAAASEVEALMPMLDDPPQVTWAVHIAMLHALGKLGLEPPSLDYLLPVDNLHVQVALAMFQQAA